MKRVVVIALTIVFMCATIFELDQASAKTSKLKKVEGMKITDPLVPGSKYCEATIQWNKVNSAKKYEVYRLSQNPYWHKYKTVKKSNENRKKYTVKNKYKVKKYRNNRYIVYKYSRKWYKKKTLTKTSYKATKLKKGKTYKFKVRAKKGGKKGKFSKVAVIKISKTGAVRITDSKGVTKYYVTNEGYDFITKAKRHVGPKYKKAGKHLKDPMVPGDENALDCTGLVQELYKKYVGISLPGGKHTKMINKALELGGIEIAGMDKVAVGDILFYKVDGGTGQHVAIYAGNGTILECTKSRKGWENPNNTTGETKNLNGVYIRPNYIKYKPFKIIRILNTKAENGALNR